MYIYRLLLISACLLFISAEANAELKYDYSLIDAGGATSIDIVGVSKNGQVLGYSTPPGSSTKSYFLYDREGGIKSILQIVGEDLVPLDINESGLILFAAHSSQTQGCVVSTFSSAQGLTNHALPTDIPCSTTEGKLSTNGKIGLIASQTQNDGTLDTYLIRQATSGFEYLKQSGDAFFKKDRFENISGVNAKGHIIAELITGATTDIRTIFVYRAGSSYVELKHKKYNNNLYKVASFSPANNLILQEGEDLAAVFARFSESKIIDVKKIKSKKYPYVEVGDINAKGLAVGVAFDKSFSNQIPFIFTSDQRFVNILPAIEDGETLKFSSLDSASNNGYIAGTISVTSGETTREVGVLLKRAVKGNS